MVRCTRCAMMMYICDGWGSIIDTCIIHIFIHPCYNIYTTRSTYFLSCTQYSNKYIEIEDDPEYS